MSQESQQSFLSNLPRQKHGRINNQGITTVKCRCLLFS